MLAHSSYSRLVTLDSDLITAALGQCPMRGLLEEYA